MRLWVPAEAISAEPPPPPAVRPGATESSRRRPREPEGGGPPGWVKAVEFNTGIKFQTLLGAPDSAALVVTKGGERALSKREFLLQPLLAYWLPIS